MSDSLSLHKTIFPTYSNGGMPVLQSTKGVDDLNGRSFLNSKYSLNEYETKKRKINAEFLNDNPSATNYQS